MPETADHRSRRRQRRQREVERYHTEGLGDEALHFSKWFTRTQFQLMESFLGELNQRPVERDRAWLQERFLRACRHGQRALVLQGIVSVLVVLGAATAAGSSIVDRLTTVNSHVPGLFQMPFDTFERLLAGIAAVAASLTLVLVIVRFAVGRYAAMVQVAATFLAMELASSRYA